MHGSTWWIPSRVRNGDFGQRGPSTTTASSLAPATITTAPAVFPTARLNGCWMRAHWCPSREAWPFSLSEYLWHSGGLEGPAPRYPRKGEPIALLDGMLRALFRLLHGHSAVTKNGSPSVL